MVDLDTSSFLDEQIAIHAKVSASFIVRPVECGIGIPPKPNAEFLVEPPGVFHEFLGGQILFSLALVEVKHEEL